MFITSFSVHRHGAWYLWKETYRIWRVRVVGSIKCWHAWLSFSSVDRCCELEDDKEMRNGNEEKQKFMSSFSKWYRAICGCQLTPSLLPARCLLRSNIEAGKSGSENALKHNLLERRLGLDDADPVPGCVDGRTCHYWVALWIAARSFNHLTCKSGERHPQYSVTWKIDGFVPKI